MNSSIKFDCPKCGADQHAYLNTSAHPNKEAINNLRAKEANDHQTSKA